MPKTKEKLSNYERTKELTDRLESGMKDLYQSDKYINFLKSMSFFHNYSRKNIMLINMQMPGATRIASYGLWKEKFNRQVKKGETGIRIFAPVKDKAPEKKLMEKLDPETGAPLLDKDGKVIMEEMTAAGSGIRFKLVSVFDVSQTTGAPLPELVENLTGNVEHYTAFMDALKEVSPLPIVFEPLREGQDGYCRFGEKIGIREGMSEIQTVSAVVHEITHARVHDKEKGDESSPPKTIGIKEVEAESISYVVCQRYSIETSPNSFGYLAEWGSRDLSEFKASLDTIRKEANNLINDIDSHFRDICKERGIDLSPKEPEMPAPPALDSSEYIKMAASAAINGDIQTGDWVVSARNNDYHYLIGQVKEIVKLGAPEHAEETTNDTDAIHVDFTAFEYPPERVSEIEDRFSRLYGEQKAFDELPLDDVIMAPDMLISAAGITSGELRRIGSSHQNCEAFCNTFINAAEPDTAMPDTAIGIAEMNQYGYQFEDMLPLTQKKALEFYDKGQPIYLLYPDNSEAMALDRSEIKTFDGIFGIGRGEWERTLEYASLSAKNSEPAKESGIINGDTDMFGIYQLKNIEELRYHRFASINQLEADNLAVDRSNYGLAYAAPLPPKESLEDLYQRFNNERPMDYTGRSLSVSDVIVIQRDGDVSSHYVDNAGFAELPAFLGNERRTEITAAPGQADIAADKPITQPAAERQQPEMMELGQNIQPERDNKTAPPHSNYINQSVYMKSPDNARKNNELDKYRESLRLNKDCAGAIGAAIKDCVTTDKPGYRLTPEAVRKVIDEYGEQRVSIVLANTVRLADWDGRYSKNTKDWANSVEMPEDRDNRAFFSSAHPAVLDGYIRLARKEMDNPDKKPSILDALKQGADKIRQAEPPQKEIPRKKKGLEV